MANKTVPARSRGILHFMARRSPFTRQVVLPVEAFVHSESAGALFLLLAAVTALVWANSPWSGSYFHLRETIVTLKIGPFAIAEDVLHWINDGLMTIFFFVVALEIKRELVHGELSAIKKAALPVAGAIGGMILPVAVFLAFNWGGRGHHGWGIPMATDIAFALGTLALLGKRIPFAVRIFLLAYAIVDDIGAILVIAIFYSGPLAFQPVLWAMGVLLVIVGFRYAGVRNLPVYVILGVIFWAAVFESGIHATIAGVILGLLAPARAWIGGDETADELQKSLPHLRSALKEGHRERAEAILGEIDMLSRHSEAPLERIERQVHPWVSFLILPLFALANAGITFSSKLVSGALTSQVTLGVACGLLAGKFVGLSGFAWLAVRLRAAALPDGTTWRHVLGTALLGGIGFTVSIFIGDLAFRDAQLAAEAKIGILVTSLVAAVAGWLFLRLAVPAPRTLGRSI
jgi:Na+:H+ antiporter, NhaA family